MEARDVFPSLQNGKGSRSHVAVDMAPMIDMVFILLIFFLVTTSFERTTGIEIETPAAATGVPLDQASLRVAIAPSGALYVEGEPLAEGELEALLEEIGRARGGSVLVIPDVDVRAGRLVEVMDLVRAKGVTDVAVATRKRSER
jgi:biopolymer transport protein ExbD